MLDAPFSLSIPQKPDSAVVFASPHSGRLFPELSHPALILDEFALRSSEDAFVEQLYASAPMQGAPLIAARISRAFVDLNRGADELDPALIEGAARQAHNTRVSSGLGVIPRVVANGRPIYRGKISGAEAAARIDAVWRPYHKALADLLDRAQSANGLAVLIDCHSMPHEAVEGASFRHSRPQVVIGDRYGTSAAAHISDSIESAFAEAGFRTARNTPFAGAYGAQAYGRPQRGRHAVQVEIDRSLYMDEAKITLHSGYGELAERLGGVVARLAAIGRRGELPLAAE